MIETRIKELRKAHSLTQAELARAINVTQSAIAKYEKGAATPSDEVKLLIADYFGVSLDYLIGVTDGIVSKQDNGEAQLLSAYRQLNALGRELVIDYVYDLIAKDKYKEKAKAI